MYRARYLMGLGPGEDSFDFVDFEATYRRKATKTYDLRRLRAQLRWKYLQMHLHQLALLQKEQLANDSRRTSNAKPNNPQTRY